MKEETGVQTGGVALGAIGSAAVQEHVQCAMEVGASPLGAAVRMNLTFGCAIGDAILRDVGRLKLTFLGVHSTLGDLGCLGGLIVGGKGGLEMGAVVGSLYGLFGGWKSC